MHHQMDCDGQNQEEVANEYLQREESLASNLDDIERAPRSVTNAIPNALFFFAMRIPSHRNLPVAKLKPPSHESQRAYHRP
jgi:hypothetical protein